MGQTVDYLFTLLSVILKSMAGGANTYIGLEPESTHPSFEMVLDIHPWHIENGRYTSVVPANCYRLSQVLLSVVLCLHHLLPDDQSCELQDNHSQLPQLRSLQSLQLRLW